MKLFKYKFKDVAHLDNVRLLVQAGIEQMDTLRKRGTKCQLIYDQAYEEGKLLLRALNELYFLWRDYE